MLKNELNKPKSESTNNVGRNKLEEINDDAKALNLTIEYVNEWVKDHPGTDPNYYEFIELLVSFGRLTSAATKYFEGNKCWPLLPTGKPMDHHDAWRSTPELECCYLNLEKLKKARKISEKGFTDFWLSDISAAAYHFFTDLEKDCVTGMYNDCLVFEDKKKLICSSFGVLFHIWQEQRKYADSEAVYQLAGQAEYQLANQLSSLSDWRLDYEIAPMDSPDQFSYQSNDLLGSQLDDSLGSLLLDYTSHFLIEYSTSKPSWLYSNGSEYDWMSRMKTGYFSTENYPSYKGEINAMFELITGNSEFADSGQQASASNGGKSMQKKYPC